MTARLFVLASLCVCGAARAEIVDRIAANVGPRIIAESEVLEAARIAAFIEGTDLDPSPENRRKVLDRLIDQTLIRREIEFVRFQPPGRSEVAPLLAQIKARYGSEQAYRDALAKYGLSEKALVEHLTWQITLLRFIEYRFQPGVEATTALIRQEYRQQTRNWKEKNGADPPPLESMRDDLERIVRQRLVDSAMDRWLGEVRTQTRIRYREGYK